MNNITPGAGMGTERTYLNCVINAQEASLDSLDSARLQYKMDKAVKIRNIGRSMVIVPPVFGVITGLGIWFPDDDSEPDFLTAVFNVLLFYAVAYTAIPLMITGGILWVVGSKRIDRVGIALNKFNLTPVNSMAIGIGITFNLRF